MKKEKKPIMPIILAEGDLDVSVPLKVFFQRYMDDITPRLKQSTVESKLRIVQEYILPYLGDVPIKDITPQYIRTWQNKVLSQFDFSNAYFNLIDRQCTSIFTYAKKYFDIPSPFDKAGHIRLLQNHNMSIWSVEEFQNFITYFQNDLYLKTVFEVLYWNGLRIGEALALTPEDVCKSPMELRVCKALSSTSMGEIISTPKTRKANRRISLPQFVYNDLMLLIDKNKIKAKARIFDSSRSYIREHMVEGYEANGLRPIRIHDLRHSHVSLLIQMGYSPVLISERVGHEKVSTTLNTYAHLFPSQQGMIASSLEQVNAIGVTPSVKLI